MAKHHSKKQRRAENERQQQQKEMQDQQRRQAEQLQLALQQQQQHMLMMRMMQQPMSMQGFFPAAFQDRVMSLPSSSARIDLDAPASSQAPGRTKKATSVSRSRSSSSSSSTRSRRKKYDTSLRSRITGSASILHALPKTRRAQLLEHIDPRLDAALTADLDTESISKILWMLTKVKPNTKIADLRVKRYDQLGSLMSRAAVRVASTPGHTDLLDRIGADLLEVNKGAAGMGWLDEFLKPPQKATTKGATTKPQLHLQVVDGQLQLQPPVPASGPGPASGQQQQARRLQQRPPPAREGRQQPPAPPTPKPAPTD